MHLSKLAIPTALVAVLAFPVASNAALITPGNAARSHWGHGQDIFQAENGPGQMHQQHRQEPVSQLGETELQTHGERRHD